jgi:hypothetical protein
MKSIKPKNPPGRLFRAICSIVALFAIAQTGFSQVSTVVFEDDFSSDTIDPAKYEASAPFFEGGIGDIHAEAGNGVMRFVGTTTQQWWSGGTLKVVPKFTPTADSPITVSIDRVSEAGQGTASRSALWILDETRNNYILFADVRGEGGWHYNQKIGSPNDVPTGGGPNIAVFDGAEFDDGGLHRMSLQANGSTVKLMLDGKDGVELEFPFSPVVIEFGSYARANNDTADTTWDNLKIEAVQSTVVVFSDDFSSDTIDAGKYTPSAPFFEGGVGDIHAEAGNGVMRFVGTTTQQWWSGGTLQVVPKFEPSAAAPVTVSIDRVAEAGQGTASRSALWVLDETGLNYVLFADVRGEGGWHYNQKIGSPDDVPTGGGPNIAAFDGAPWDDGGLHRMSMVANGSTVKLILDGVVGTEVAFPFSPVRFEFGSYARANNDTADTTWDNLEITTVPKRSNVVFSDDFSSDVIDPARYAPDAPFFEGGTGDIRGEAGNGVMRFVGTTTQQWWSGGTLRVVPTFAPSESETVTVSIDRVSEAGQGTASRSALWILDETKSNYVLFADVRGEGGWHYNLKIGSPNDVPTGGGPNIAAFDGAPWDDGGLHRMSMVADGKTVKLLLDGVQGVELPFPFSPVIFQFGSYARANNDTADTTWDNLTIESEGSATFDPADIGVRVGQVSSDVTVRIPQGLNLQGAVKLKIASSNPAVAVPEGGTGGELTLTFPQGGANTASFKIRGVALGGAEFTASGDVGVANKLGVAVISGPALLLEENFAGASIDTAKWTVSNQSFEATGAGTFTATQAGGVLTIEGYTDADFWGGAAIKTAKSYLATKDLNLVFEVDRVLIDQVGTAGRTAVFITNADRSKFVHFSQNVGENNWQVNVNPGSATGQGTTLSAFAGIVDLNSHKMKMVADGKTVEVFLDGVSGGKYPFEVNSGIHFEIGAYARALDDYNKGAFDNVRIENVVPCVSASPSTVTMTVADSGAEFDVTVPTLLHDASPATVKVTSANPSIAVPAGAVNGVLTLTFAPGASNTQAVKVVPVGLGTTTFTMASTPASCVTGAVKVEVIAFPEVFLTDDFAGASFDTANWVLDANPFDSGVATAESGLTIDNGQVKIDVTAEQAAWAGAALFTAKTYKASATEPLTFEIDRTKLDFVLVTGTGAQQRAGVWVRDAAGHFVFFSEFLIHSGGNPGWGYNLVNGGANDNPTGRSVNIPAFDGGKFDDRGNHRVRLVVNGSTAKLILDGVLGAEVDFPFSQGLTFGFGAYVNAATDVVRGYFDNAVVKGGASAAPVASRVSAARQDANVVISWTGGGTLQEAPQATGPWSDVPAAANPFTAPASAPSKFFRVRN